MTLRLRHFITGLRTAGHGGKLTHRIACNCSPAFSHSHGARFRPVTVMTIDLSFNKSKTINILKAQGFASVLVHLHWRLFFLIFHSQFLDYRDSYFQQTNREKNNPQKGNKKRRKKLEKLCRKMSKPRENKKITKQNEKKDQKGEKVKKQEEMFEKNE